MSTAHPYSHWLVYGESGTEKSTFLATFPTPILVFCFDPHGKDAPYLRRGVPGPLQQGAYPYRDVTHRRTGDLLIRLEYFHDLMIPTEFSPVEKGKDAGKARAVLAAADRPQAYANFLRRIATRPHDEGWATIGLDSVTYVEMAARGWAQHVLNPTTSDPRQWWNEATDRLEDVLLKYVAGLPLNVVVLAHVDEAKDEEHGLFIRNPRCPGRLRKLSGSGYAEFYRAYTNKATGEHVLQTRSDATWNAASQIPAPNPCPPHYHALWAGAPPDSQEAD